MQAESTTDNWQRKGQGSKAGGATMTGRLVKVMEGGWTVQADLVEKPGLLLLTGRE